MGREFKSMTEMISTKGYGIMRKATSHVKDDNQVMLQFSAVAESGLSKSSQANTFWHKFDPKTCVVFFTALQPILVSTCDCHIFSVATASAFGNSEAVALTPCVVLN